MLHLKKKKKNTRRYHYFTPAYQKSWWYDLQFWDIDCDRLKLVIVGLFCPFLSPPPPPPSPLSLPKKNPNNRYNFLSIWATFCPFEPPNNLNNQNFEKMKKKTPGDNIILHLCTTNDNHTMYGSWDMECYSQNFLSFWPFFALLPH